MLFHAPIFAATIIIKKSIENPPYISDTLNSFLYDPDVGPVRGGTGQDLVGFNGYELDDVDPAPINGGDGVDETVPISFDYFPIFSSLSQATLTLSLTPKNSLISTDELQFADIWAASGPEPFRGYGNAEVKDLKVDTYYTEVSFNLLNLSNKNGTFYNLSKYILDDGDLDLVYTDDALVHGASLKLVGTLVPEPSSTILLGCGLLGLIGISRCQATKGS
jgi:hypothetical protein